VLTTNNAPYGYSSDAYGRKYPRSAQEYATDREIENIFRVWAVGQTLLHAGGGVAAGSYSNLPRLSPSSGGRDFGYGTGEPIDPGIFARVRARIETKWRYGMDFDVDESLGLYKGATGSASRTIFFGTNFRKGVLPLDIVFYHELGHAVQRTLLKPCDYEAQTPQQKEDFVLEFLKGLMSGTLTPGQLEAAEAYAKSYHPGGSRHGKGQ
jgi:hypothetical protein